LGEIINISCKNCNDNEDYFLGMGMSGQLTNLYHCPKCNYLDLELDQGIENFLDDIKDFIANPNIKNMYCSKCKSSNNISVMNVIKYKDVPKYNCHKCNKKQLEVFPAGDWD
jgi:Zn finger protein HypA/HybF involved in hydrogenase expression